MNNYFYLVQKLATQGKNSRAFFFLFRQFAQSFKKKIDLYLPSFNGE